MPKLAIHLGHHREAANRQIKAHRRRRPSRASRWPLQIEPGGRYGISTPRFPFVPLCRTATYSSYHDPCPGEFVARLMTTEPTPYVILADTLVGLQAQLPLGLTRTDRQSADPPEVVEVWFPAAG